MEGIQLHLMERRFYNFREIKTYLDDLGFGIKWKVIVILRFY